jgi:DNA-binding transcriptional LysR family regulator
LRITLRQIAVFEAVARNGTIAGAAEEIGLSPSAASMSLKDFETHLGVRLFARSGRRMRLTEQGRAMVELAGAVLVGVADMEALSLPEAVRGRLRIGAADPVGNYVLPRICAAFMRQHPGVRVELRVLPSQEVMDGVRKMAFDIGFVGAPVNASTLDAEPWLRDGLAVCVAPDYPLPPGGETSLARLAQEPWILEKTESSERISFTVETLKYVNSLNVAFETDSMEAIKHAVREGAGLACLSRLAVREEVARGELRLLDLPELRFTRIVSLVSRRQTRLPAAARAFRAFCRTAGLAPGERAPAPE